MQDYDGALKLLLQATAAAVLRQITGMTITRWLNAEVPRVQTMLTDLLGETADGHLMHIELQASNDPFMALRMAEYALRIYRKFGKYPRQIVLYVGAEPPGPGANREPGRARQACRPLSVSDNLRTESISLNR